MTAPRCSWLALAFVLGCGGPTADLASARRAHDAGDLYRALALLRIVGEDEQTLPLGQRAQHAYLRGLTDLRIAATLPDRLAEERRVFLGCARRWLERARELAPEPSSAGLESAQIELVRESLRELDGVRAEDCDRPATAR